jgi:hypothetical protein
MTRLKQIIQNLLYIKDNLILQSFNQKLKVRVLAPKMQITQCHKKSILYDV